MTVPGLVDVFPTLSKAIAALAANTATPGAGFAQLFATLVGADQDGDTPPLEPGTKEQGNAPGAAEALAGAAAAAAASTSALAGAAAAAAAAPNPPPLPTGGSGEKVAVASDGSGKAAPASPVAGVPVELGSAGAVETAEPVGAAPAPDAPASPGGQPAPPAKHGEPPAPPAAATHGISPPEEPAASALGSVANPATPVVAPSALVQPGTGAAEPEGTVAVTASSTPAVHDERHRGVVEGSRPVEAQTASVHVEKLALSGETAGGGDRARGGGEEGRAPGDHTADIPLAPRHDASSTTPPPLESPVSREAGRADLPREARPDVPLARDVDRLLGLEKARPLAVRDGGEMRLEVSPEGLGRIEMHVAVHADGVNASLYAAHDHARETLEAHRASLAAALGRSNLRLEGFTVGLGQERRDPEPRRDEGRASGATPATTSPISVAPTPAIDAGAPASGLSLRA